MEYYVAPNGNDLNPGTLAEPWLTPVQAAQVAQAGDTVYFREGVYPIPQTGTGYGPKFNANGTAEELIIFSNYGDEQVVFDGGNLDVPFWCNGTHLVFRGLEFRNVLRYVIAVVNGYVTIEGCRFIRGGDARQDTIKVLREGHYTIIRNCYFEGTALGCNQIDSFGSNLVVERCAFMRCDAPVVLIKGGSRNNLVAYNLFRECGPPPDTSENWTHCVISVGGESTLSYKTGPWEIEETVVHDNVILDCEASGIYFWEARNCAAYYNTIVSPQGNLGIAVFGNKDEPGRFPYSEDVAVVNNLIYCGERMPLYVAAGSETTLRVTNNLWWHPAPTIGFTWGGTIKGGAASGWISGSLEDWRAFSGQSAHDLWADPLVGPDGRLTEESPARRAGVLHVYQDWPDFDGNERDFPVDIGAFAYLAEEPEPEEPTPDPEPEPEPEEPAAVEYTLEVSGTLTLRLVPRG